MPTNAAAPTPTTGDGTSLYVHVPFCVVKCGYCDFNSYVVADSTAHDRFLDALDCELTTARPPREPISVFIGGGTPSLLDPARLQRLFEVLRRHVDLPHCPEVTMEANPESFSAEKGRLARAAGVNRVSIGVQSFAEHHLRFLDRAHSSERARAAFAEAREAGFTNVSLDLIFAVPGQTLADWEQDLRTALSMRPDHLSCYNLTYEPGTRLHRDLAQSRFEANPEESDRSMFLRTREALGQAGYEAYEISNFAGAGGRCRHNDHYWLQGDYVGVGPGACSHRSGVRTTNIKPLEAWAAAALRGQQPGSSAETLTPRQRAGEAVWLGLRRVDGVDLAAVSRRLQLPVGDWFAPLVARLARADLLLQRGTQLLLTQQGLLFADRVSGEFLSGMASPSDSESQAIGKHLG